MWIVRERLKSKDKDGWSPVDAWVKNKHVFFFGIYSTPNWTGSVRLGFCWFQVSETETEPNWIFLKKF